MPQPAITITGLSKKYKIGASAHGSLSSWVRSTLQAGTQRTAELFWALREIDLEIQGGEVFGLVGHNGAGKSTLLKILSRITGPTSGRIELRGRVASLLEVGTGFHPDLTGRENIEMNAALLGMTRPELKKQFDEIVSFSGVEAFIDTPVKRYSSGMGVRLGFAVAAHLRSEILIVDEVLTVGDAEFQRRCMGKMQGVAQSGRTVLFVSHNLAAVQSLCSHGCLLDQGRVMAIGPIRSVIRKYIDDLNLGEKRTEFRWTTPPEIQSSGTRELRLLSVRCIDGDGLPSPIYSVDQSITIEFRLQKAGRCDGVRIGFSIRTQEDIVLFGSNATVQDLVSAPMTESVTVVCQIPAHLLNEGSYTVDIGLDRIVGEAQSFQFLERLSFNVIDTVGHGIKGEKLPGVVRPQLKWSSHA